MEFRRILYATDFSELSAYALKHAAYLAQKCGAQLHCLYVVDDSYQYWMTFELATVPAGPPVAELVATAEGHLKDFLAERLPAGLEFHAHVLHGRPFVEIIRYARDEHMDLIVVGTHGRTGLRHVLMGSVADKVVRKSPCPVLTVRHPDHPFEMP
jgi:nucleotide-binding universal stress UspA family protein